MSRKFSLCRDYYDNGYPLYAKKNIEIKEGVTVLVGCNGIGKTTLLHQISEKLKNDKIPHIMFDNLTDGGSNSRQESLWKGDMAFLATSATSSEGENIVLDIGKLAKRLGDFVRTGEDKEENPLAYIFKRHFDDADKKIEIPKERWIILDAVDSGLSVDNVVELKESLFDTIIKYNFGNKIYIVVSANEYEMARGEQCFDVYRGEYTELKDYDDYRKFILNSRKIKEKREEEAHEKDSKNNISEEDYDL